MSVVSTVPLLGKWYCKHMNNLVKGEAFIEPIRIQGAELKIFGFYAFLYFFSVEQYRKLSGKKGARRDWKHLLAVFPALLCLSSPHFVGFLRSYSEEF